MNKIVNALIAAGTISVLNFQADLKAAEPTKSNQTKKAEAQHYHIITMMIPASKDHKYNEFSDYVMSTYPVGDWHYDLDKSNDSKKVVAFYATKPADVISYLQEMAPHYKLKMGLSQCRLIGVNDWTKIKKKLEE